MYYYIVDPQKISQNDFERVQNQLYSSTSQYRVSGEVVRATGLRTVSQLVENAFAHDAKTIVAVGSDETLHDVINAVGSRDMVIGFVPLFDSEIGSTLGLINIPQAAKTLGARRIEELDLGSVNNNLFLSKLSFGASQVSSGSRLNLFNFRRLQSLMNLPLIEIKFAADGQYQASIKVVGGVIVNGFSDPTDGVLDISMLSQLSRWQVFKYRREIAVGNYEKIPGSAVIHVQRLEITAPDGLPLRVGSRIVARAPAVIEVKPKALKIIVGKERMF